jgi:hypothetical protein
MGHSIYDKQKDLSYHRRRLLMKSTEAQKAAAKKYYRENKERQCNLMKKRNAAVRLEGLMAYSDGQPKCDCCGETTLEFLSIDHVNGGGSKHRKELNGISIYAWLKRNKYPVGFRVLCHNCNLSIGYYGYCPHSPTPI